MASHGKVLDLFDERYLNLQDVQGNVAPLPNLVPYIHYKQDVLVYEMDSSHDVFIGLFQDFTDRQANTLEKELWTWLVQWQVERASSVRANKKIRIDDLTSAGPNIHIMSLLKLLKPLPTVARRFLDRELMHEEGMLRILIDIIQADGPFLPNFIELLYEWIDFFEGNGYALQCAMRGEIPSLWDFEFHPAEMPDLTMIEPELKGEKRKKPDIQQMEELAVMRERQQYKERKYGLEVPHERKGLSPLVNVTKSLKKRHHFHAACFKSRQRALGLVLEAGITLKQVNNYVKNQKEHPRMTIERSDGRGTVNYFKDKPYATGYHFQQGKSMILRQRYHEALISRTLATQARQATTISPHSQSCMPESGAHLIVPPPLIPPTPATPWMPPVQDSSAPQSWRELYSSFRKVEVDPQVRTFVRWVPPILLDNLKTNMIASIPRGLTQMITQQAMARIYQPQGGDDNEEEGEGEGDEEDAFDCDGDQSTDNSGDEMSDQDVHMQDVVAEARTLAQPRSLDTETLQNGQLNINTMTTIDGNPSLSQIQAPASISGSGNYSGASTQAQHVGLEGQLQGQGGHSTAPSQQPVSPNQLHGDIEQETGIASETSGEGEIPTTAGPSAMRLPSHSSPQHQLSRLPGQGAAHADEVFATGGPVHPSDIPISQLNPSAVPSTILAPMQSAVQSYTTSNTQLQMQLPQPSIKRKPPSPIKTSGVSALMELITKATPTKAMPHGIPTLLYFPKVLEGTGYEEATDALLLGHIPHHGTEIRIEKAVFTKAGIWQTLKFRVKTRAWRVLESYPSDKKIYGTGKEKQPICDSLPKKNPHEEAYDKLAQAYSFMADCTDREEELTKRWKTTPGPLTARDRGSIWEGYALKIDQEVIMSKEERKGALVYLRVGADAYSKEAKEEERAREEQEEFELPEEECAPNSLQG